MTIKLRIYQTDSAGTVYRKPKVHLCEPGRLSERLAEIGIQLPNSCGGLGRCGKCRVMLLKKSDPGYRDWFGRKAPSFKEVSSSVPSVPACQVFLNESALVFLHRPGEISSAAAPRVVTSSARRRFALAVDLGSTNIDGVLLDLETGAVSAPCSVKNPQREYGSDIVSRLGAVVGRKHLAEECRVKTHEAVGELVRTLAYHESVPETAVVSSVKSAAVAGNSVVTYLFLGIDPRMMTVPPYEPAALDFSPRPASSCGFPLSEGGVTVTVPLLGGLIGGDLTAGIFALQTNPEYGFTFGTEGAELLVDVGTNSEMLLFKEGKIYASQAAAGPVFEGETLSCGSRAEPNAIGHVRIAGEGALSGLAPDAAMERIEFEMFGAEGAGLPVSGLAGSAVIDLVAELLRTGDLNLTGKLRKSVPITEDLRFTQKDVRQVQLAIGAIRAGLTVLLESANVEWKSVRKLYVSGGLGSGLCFANAQRVGLFPGSFDPARFVPCGNTSLQGTLALLRRGELMGMAGTLRKKMCRVSLGGNPRFRDEFVRAMRFPEG